MRHSSLAAFLHGAISPAELWREIGSEVCACASSNSKPGGVGHIIVTDGPETQVTREHVDVLLAALARAEMPLKAASYIADALIMSDGFDWEDDAVAEALFDLSDEGRQLTVADIRAARSRLSIAP